MELLVTRHFGGFNHISGKQHQRKDKVEASFEKDMNTKKTVYKPKNFKLGLNNTIKIFGSTRL